MAFVLKTSKTLLRPFSRVNLPALLRRPFTALPVPHDPKSASKNTGKALRKHVPSESSLIKHTDKIDGIWLKHKGFTPNPQADFLLEFDRLAEYKSWDDDKKKQQRPKYIAADFGTHYGKNSKELAKWQDLCRVCKVDPIPSTIKGCKTALKKVLVNIVNLIDSCRVGEEIIIFQTKLKFIDYTWPHKTYPLDKAAANPFMEVLLRKVSCPKYRKQAVKEDQDKKSRGKK